MLLNNHRIGKVLLDQEEINKVGCIASTLVYAEYSSHKLETGRELHNTYQSREEQEVSPYGGASDQNQELPAPFTNTAFTKASSSDDPLIHQ
jgi:hypothetical protein